MKTSTRSFAPFAVAGLVALSFVVHPAAAATSDACDLVPQADVARIIGNDAPIAQRRPPAGKDGATSSVCYYQLPGMEGVNASLTLQAFPSPAAAQAQLASFVEQRRKLRATVEAETVAGLPATAVTLPTGVGQIWVVRGSQLVAAGVSSLQHGKATAQPDKARVLLVAALKAL